MQMNQVKMSVKKKQYLTLSLTFYSLYSNKGWIYFILFLHAARVWINCSPFFGTITTQSNFQLFNQTTP